uniref:Uncharacterized protein n=1 Tax=Ursus americanus TaxID=9643 RepID=A0A452R8P8_URSAM
LSFQGPQMPARALRGRAEHRSAVYSSSVSTNRLDTAQMATIRYTLTSQPAPLPRRAPANTRDDAFGAWPPPTATAAQWPWRSAGSPWSFTSTSRRWRAESASSRVRVVLISPVYSASGTGCARHPPPNHVLTKADYSVSRHIGVFCVLIYLSLSVPRNARHVQYSLRGNVSILKKDFIYLFVCLFREKENLKQTPL